MKLEKLRRSDSNGCFQKRARPPLLSLTSTEIQESEPMGLFFFSIHPEFTKVSQRKMTLKWYVRIRWQRIGIALELSRPREFQPRKIIFLNRLLCQGLPIKKSCHFGWVVFEGAWLAWWLRVMFWVGEKVGLCLGLWLWVRLRSLVGMDKVGKVPVWMFVFIRLGSRGVAGIGEEVLCVWEVVGLGLVLA